MRAPHVASFDDLPAADKRLVNEACERFESALQAGHAGRIADHLAGAPEPLRPVLLAELLRLECEYRAWAGSGETPQGPPRAGPYALSGELGRGGFGVVYRATDTRDGREWALKVPHAAVQAEPGFRERFAREAAAAARLDHPNVLRVREAGADGPVCYLAAEYVAGPTLADWLAACQARGEPVPVRTAAELVAALADAVEHAHGRGVLHRDLKPANVLLDVRAFDGHAAGGGRPHGVLLGPAEVGTPKVADFGLARLTDADAELSRTGQVVGTPAFMAPEQVCARRAAVSVRTDVYALGAVLYALLAGRPPFAHGSVMEMLFQVLHDDPPGLRGLRRDVPADLEAVCLHCLEKDPGRRYGSASALADDLRRWLGGRRVLAPRVGPLGHAVRWCRRRPGVAALATALGLALTAGIAGVGGQYLRAVVARQDAEVSDEQARRLLYEFLQPSPDAPLSLISSVQSSDTDALLKAEAHFAGLLQRRPSDAEVRVALTIVRGSLGSLSVLRGRTDEAEVRLRGARELWVEQARQNPRDAQAREWLAYTDCWQAEVAVHQRQFGRSARLKLRAYALGQELAEERPGDPALLRCVAIRRFELLALSDTESSRGEALRALEEERDLVGRVLARGPASWCLRKRLAFICLALGEFHLGAGQRGQALPYWREADALYTALSAQQPGDVLVELNLALCRARLAAEQSPVPDDADAVRLLRRVCDRLAQLARQDPAANWVRAVLLEAYCTLAISHWRAGRAALAEQTFGERVRPLVAHAAGGTRAGLRQGMACLQYLSRTAGMLEEGQPAAALVVAREAAALAERSAETPSRDPASCECLAARAAILSVYLRRLGDAEESHHQAELARGLYAGLRRSAPEVPRYGHGLSGAWVWVAKARWALGRRAEAMAAFQEAAAVQREVVGQAPSVTAYREALRRCYEMLAYWGGQAGDRATAAAALRDQERLWPGDAQVLTDVARAFRKLADAVGQGPLSPEEQAERESYLAAGERARRAAERRPTAPGGPHH